MEDLVGKKGGDGKDKGVPGAHQGEVEGEEDDDDDDDDDSEEVDDDSEEDEVLDTQISHKIPPPSTVRVNSKDNKLETTGAEAEVARA